MATGEPLPANSIFPSGTVGKISCGEGEGGVEQRRVWGGGWGLYGNWVGEVVERRGWF